MDLQGIASGLVSSSVGQSLNVDVLKAVQNLDQSQAALLFASIGLGASVNALA